MPDVCSPLFYHLTQDKKFSSKKGALLLYIHYVQDIERAATGRSIVPPQLDQDDRALNQPKLHPSDKIEWRCCKTSSHMLTELDPRRLLLGRHWKLMVLASGSGSDATFEPPHLKADSTKSTICLIPDKTVEGTISFAKLFLNETKIKSLPSPRSLVLSK